MAGTFNRTLNFLPTGHARDWELQSLPVTESVAYEMGSAMDWDSAGKLQAATASTADFAGILMAEVASTDDDYATEYKRKIVAVPKNRTARAEFAVGAGTFTVADVGKGVKFNDLKGLAVDTDGNQARITKFISSSRGECEFTRTIA
jgi:hypothetical protein